MTLKLEDSSARVILLNKLIVVRTIKIAGVILDTGFNKDNTPALEYL
jgi:hypothetical protein